MKYNSFIEQLKSSDSTPLKFRHQNQILIAEGYHITEVKDQRIHSMDCGGFEHRENQVVVQIYNPDIKEEGFMSTKKALGILTKVTKSLSIPEDAIVLFEYGANDGVKIQYHPTMIQLKDKGLVIDLNFEPVACKPAKAGLSCC